MSHHKPQPSVHLLVVVAVNHNQNLLRYGSAPSSLFDTVVHLGTGATTTNNGTYSSSIPSTTTTMTTHCFSVIDDSAAANEYHHPPARPNQGGFGGGRSFGGVNLGRSGEVVGVFNSNAGNYAAPPSLVRTSSSLAVVVLVVEHEEVWLWCVVFEC
ncbi:hypothetical protein Droror1_Dr00023823 [Drosera rotundifolia]